MACSSREGPQRSNWPCGAAPDGHAVRTVMPTCLHATTCVH
jgi:hypothetical protein